MMDVQKSWKVKKLFHSAFGPYVPQMILGVKNGVVGSGERDFLQPGPYAEDTTMLLMMDKDVEVE